MTGKDHRYNMRYDLTNCEEEPLRFIRSCQGHARLLVLEKTSLKLKAYSDNWPSFFSDESINAFNSSITDFLSEDFCQVLNLHVNQSDADVHHPLSYHHVLPDGSIRPENVIVHQQDDQLILEFEPRQDDVIGGKFM